MYLLQLNFIEAASVPILADLISEDVMQAETVRRSAQKTETMQLLGLQGSDCVATLDKAISSLDGVAEVTISMSDEKATITYDVAQTSIKRMQAAIKKAGYDSLKPVHGEDGNCCGGCGG